MISTLTMLMVSASYTWFSSSAYLDVYVWIYWFKHLSWWSNLQKFIEKDYFCEYRNQDCSENYHIKLHTEDPLWDGKGCGSLEQTCFQAPGLRWFHKVLNFTLLMEMKVSADQCQGNKDVPVNHQKWTSCYRSL